MTIRNVILSLLISVAIPSFVLADSSVFQLADMHKIKDVGAPALSPDGKLVAYTVSFHDMEKDSSTSDIWMVPYLGGKAKNLTNSKHKAESAPQFSPDNRDIAFLGEDKEDQSSQIFLMRAKGGKPRQISQVEGGVIDFSWAPDGKKIVFSAFAGGAKKSKAGTAAPIVIDRFQFKEDWVGYLDTARRQLFILDIDKKKSVQITSADQDHWLPVWSPDGKWIAYVSKNRGDTDRNLDTDVFIMPPEKDAAARKISTSTGTDVDPYWASPPAWSPDSKQLAWLESGESKWIYYAPWQLTVANIESGDVRPLARLDLCFYIPKWSEDGRFIYSLIEGNMETHLAKIDVSTQAVTYLTKGDSFSLGFDLASGHAVVQQSTDNRPFELVAVETNERLLTNHNAWLSEKTLATTKPFSFKSHGNDIDGLIVYPQDYDASKTYPTIFRLHGGPVYQFSREFMYDWQLYAAAGFIVAGINPRGSSGKGFDFSRSIYADWGNVDTQDILAGVDYLVAQGIADPDNLTIGGWSYGGMLTNYVIATDSRFKSAVSGAGTSNMFGNYGHDQYSLVYELELGTPWENRDIFDRVSFPFLHADRIKTPTLFQCAEKDFNVPCNGSEQMYQALRSLGIDTRLILYPGQHHGITIPSYLQDRMQRNLDWYRHFVTKGE
jgi:dipeptidyl aminopeptidase/acylaminoacyl peptidase